MYLRKVTKTKYSLSKKLSSSIQRRKVFLLLFISSVLIVPFSGCKDENELGLQILPPGDTLNTVFSDTVTVHTITQREDSIRSDELSFQLLGSEKDPVFGLTTASVYTQVNLAGTPSFGNMPVADSVFLKLSYAGYYGDTTASQTVTVYHLYDDMYVDSPYYSNRTFNYDPAGVGSLTFQPMPNSKFVLDTDSLLPQIWIRLNKSLADSIVALNGQSQFSSNANWLSHFKGLYLESTDATGPGSICYFNFFNSYLTVYFHDTDMVSKKYDFSLAGGRLNHFKHDYTGTVIGSQLSDSTYADSLNYCQPMAGVKIKISFPFLKHLLDSGSIAINKALLSIKPLPGAGSYSLPPKMLLLIKDSNGQNSFPIDYYESAGYYGGDLNATSDGYSFNIARQLQKYLDGKTDNADFYLVVSSAGVEANRAILRSGTNADRMKLSILYTKIK